MLYPHKKDKELSRELFQNPTPEYRGAPFWAWNCKLDKDVLMEQIEYLKEMGMGGFHIHSRTGMATEYLGDEFGKTVPAIFTDEPQFTFKQSLAFAAQKKDVMLPYTDDFTDTYRKAYGTDFLDTVPELFWDCLTEGFPQPVISITTIPATDLPKHLRIRWADGVKNTRSHLRVICTGNRHCSRKLFPWEMSCVRIVRSIFRG